MPLYEYLCKNCSRRFEKLIRVGEHPECPACGGAELEKLFSTFAAAVGGSRPAEDSGPCGTCGDPRGPGACALN